MAYNVGVVPYPPQLTIFPILARAFHSEMILRVMKLVDLQCFRIFHKTSVSSSTTHGCFFFFGASDAHIAAQARSRLKFSASHVAWQIRNSLEQVGSYQYNWHKLIDQHGPQLFWEHAKLLYTSWQRGLPLCSMKTPWDFNHIENVPPEEVQKMSFVEILGDWL